ncbi:MAG: hypothetical protein ACI865_003223 [Flavobacteriaceae bacterium]|jgi:hypothetical protein
MKQILFLFLTVILVSSCGSGGDEINSDKPIEDSTSVAGFHDVRADFSKKDFENPKHLEIIKELDVCLMLDQDSTVFAVCSPENFRIIPFKDGADIKDAFILQMKAGIVLKGQKLPLKERNIVVFEREAGELVKVNGFRGDMTAMRPGDSGAQDLVITFYSDLDETFFDCIFKWNGKRYDFKFVEALDYGEGYRAVKESIMDSLSKEIYTDLMQNALIF